MVLESRGYSIYTLAQLSWHSTGENDFWMVTFGFLLFSSPFPLSAFCSDTCKTELWMVRSWIPSFLIPFSCHSFLLKTCKKTLWMVRSWVPSFLIPVSFQSSLSNRSSNELWMGRYGGRGGRTTNTLLSPSILSNVQSFHGSTTYSIYSFAQQSWNHTGENDFWMVDIAFLLLIPFSFHSFLFRHLQDGTLDGKIVDSFFSHPLFLSFFSKTCEQKLWMVRSWVPPFLIPVSFQSFLSNRPRNELWMGRYGGRGRAHHKYTLKSEHPFKCSIFSWFYHILSIVLRSCPGTALVTFGWLILASLFFIPLFLSQLSLHLRAIMKFGWQIKDHNFSHHMFLSKILLKNLQE